MSNKKPYIAPKLEVHEIDHEISLVMLTGPPPDPGFAAPEVGDGELPIRPFNTESPFGGDRPNYDNM